MGNIPRRWDQQCLVSRLERHIGYDAFNFVHLPYDISKRKNYGFAILNCACASVAGELLDSGRLHQLLRSDGSNKQFRVAYSDSQGLILNLLLLIGSPAARDGPAPLVKHCGQVVGFFDAVAFYVPRQIVAKRMCEVAERKALKESAIMCQSNSNALVCAL